jgi:anti-sigma regulatory factor (Ser/Thr protein kinase)
MCTGLLPERSTDREIKLDPTDRAPAEARGFVRHHLADLGFPKLVDDGVLVAAELVTNAFRHAGTYGPIWLSLRLAGGRPLIEVRDRSPELPVFREPDFAAESGRGLHVVAALSAAFDWALADGGKITWALLRTAGD